MDTSKKSSWHSLSSDALLSVLDTDLKQGLSENEAEQRLAQYGQNRLTPPRGKSAFKLLLSQFNQPLVYILLLSG
ncbi:MAG: cation-transporting P-type ATPase, partial [Methylomonas lenta]|nr:cation-transporting P-type ATPase [Methylomonas lenta]